MILYTYTKVESKFYTYIGLETYLNSNIFIRFNHLSHSKDRSLITEKKETNNLPKLWIFLNNKDIYSEHRMHKAMRLPKITELQGAATRTETDEWLVR